MPGPIVVGTTSAPSTLDPAAAWDGSWELFRDIYQTLLSYPNGDDGPAAGRRRVLRVHGQHQRSLQVRTARRAQVLRRRHAWTRSGVKYSIDRIRRDQRPHRPHGLLGQPWTAW